MLLSATSFAGLVGHWAFDEGSGTTTADATGANDGTLTGGPTWLTGAALPPVPGAGAALQFDGTDDFVNTAFAGIGGANPRTVAFWLKSTDTGDHGIIGWGDELGNGKKWHLRLNSGATDGTVGAIRTEVQGGKIIGTTNIADGNWHHVASVFSGTNVNDVLHYVDGHLEGVSGSTGIAIDTDISTAAARPVSIGKRIQGTTNSWFPGSLDDMRIDDTALGFAAIKALASGAPANAYQAAVYADSPLAYYRLAESGPNKAYNDGLMSGVDGTHSHDPTENAPGLFVGATDTAYHFDGDVPSPAGTPSRVDVADNTDLNRGTIARAEKSVELTFYAEGLGQGAETRRMIYDEGGGSRGMNIYLSDVGSGNLELTIGAWNAANDDGPGSAWGGNNSKFLAAPVAPQTPYHVTLVHDGAIDGSGSPTGSLIGYINGQKFGQVTGVGRLHPHDPVDLGARDGSTRFDNGGATGGTGQGNSFFGIIDDVSIHGTALSADTIDQRAAVSQRYMSTVLADDPIGYWRLGEISGTTAYNMAMPRDGVGSGLGKAVHATYSGGTTPQGFGTGLLPDDPSGAAYFDGVDDFIAIPNHAAINTSGGYPQRTIELTFQAEDIQGRQVLFEEGGTGNGLNVYLDDGSLYFGAWTGIYTHFLQSAMDVVAGETYHTAFTFDADADEMFGYLDGMEVASLTGMAFADMATHSGRIALGAVDNDSKFTTGGFGGQGHFFAGWIDEFSLYNNALSSSVINDHYIATGLAPEPSSLVLLGLGALGLFARFRLTPSRRRRRPR